MCCLCDKIMFYVLLVIAKYYFDIVGNNAPINVKPAGGGGEAGHGVGI